jgi:hypothetical protein
MSKNTKRRGLKAKNSLRDESPRAEVEMSFVAGMLRPPVLGIVLVSSVARNQASSSAKRGIVIKAFSANNLKELSDQIRSKARTQH